MSAVHLMVVRHDLHPTSDIAGTELTTRAVGHEAVLLGSFSRDGWHHPGPLATYLYAVPYRLLGGTAAAMGVAALLVNGGAVAGMAVVARRRGGPPLALATLVVGAVLMRALGPDLLRVPWNPYVTVLPFGLLVFLTWALICRDRWALPTAVLVTSFLAQTHVGYVALGLPLLATGVLGLLVGTLGDRGGEGIAGHRWRDRLRPLVRPGAVALAVGAVVWAPPVYEELTRRPGNITAIVRWFRTGGGTGEPARGWAAGWRLVAGQYDLVPEWIAGKRPAAAFTGEPAVLYETVLPVLLPVTVLAFGWMARRRVVGVGGLALAWLVASVAGVAATARVIGPAYDYRTGWALVLGAVGGLAVVWWLGREVVERAPTVARRALAPAALGVLLVLAAASSVAHVRAGVPEAELAGLLGEVVPRTLAALPPGDGPVVVDGRTGWAGSVQAPGLVLELERRGIDARLPGAGGAGRGLADGEDDGPVRARLIVAAGRDVPAAADAADRTLVAYAGDMSLDALRRRVARDEPVADEAALAVFLHTG